MDKRRTQSETDSISHTARRHYFCMLQLLLNLQVIEARNGYKKNQKWIIPEVVLEKSARKIKAQDAAFWERLITGQMNYQDVERLILDATYGIVKLTLDEYGI